MSNYCVYSVRESDGAIYSRKMVNDTEISQKRAGAGRKGMKKRYCYNTLSEFDITKTLTNTENEIENENEVITEKGKGGVGEKPEPEPITQAQPSPLPPSIIDRKDPALMYAPGQSQLIIEEIYGLTRYLNSLTGGSLRPDHHAYCSTIWRRLQDGYTIAQMKAVIDHKFAEWGSNPRMRTHLVPTTLFSESNFDRYLSAAQLPPLAAADAVESPTEIYDRP